MKINTILVGIAMTMLLLCYALPAAASDYTLGIFGNANEDDTINMQDVTYTELIILEYRDKTELSDAKHDGKINMQDVTQIELVILGKEKELTLVDSMKRIVTVKKPIESVIAVRAPVVEMLRSVGAKDKLIGMSFYQENQYPRFFGDLNHLPNVGHLPPDCEVILQLGPDLALMDTFKSYDSCCDVLETAGVQVYRITPSSFKRPGGTPYDYLHETEKLGYLLDTEDEADEFSDWFHGFMDKITERVGELSDEEKPRTYFEYHRDYCAGSTGTVGHMMVVEFAGAKNIFGDDCPVSGRTATVDPEAVIVRDPEIIITCRGQVCNYELDDPSEAKALRDGILARPGFDEITAVKEDGVYIVPSSFFPIYGGAPCHFFIGIAYMAKLFNPELFEDLDPVAIHQEYLTEFQRIDYDVYEQGVFVYPPFEES